MNIPNILMLKNFTFRDHRILTAEYINNYSVIQIGTGIAYNKSQD
jgi:hypothetical protein